MCEMDPRTSSLQRTLGILFGWKVQWEYRHRKFLARRRIFSSERPKPKSDKRERDGPLSQTSVVGARVKLRSSQSHRLLAYEADPRRLQSTGESRSQARTLNRANTHAPPFAPGGQRARAADPSPDAAGPAAPDTAIAPPSPRPPADCAPRTPTSGRTASHRTPAPYWPRPYDALPGAGGARPSCSSARHPSFVRERTFAPTSRSAVGPVIYRSPRRAPVRLRHRVRRPDPAPRAPHAPDDAARPPLAARSRGTMTARPRERSSEISRRRLPPDREAASGALPAPKAPGCPRAGSTQPGGPGR